MNVIAAMTRDRVIGRDGALPWDIPEVHQQFLNLVAGKTVILGRHAFELFGADLTRSTNLVVSGSLGSVEGAEVFPTLEQALARGFSLGQPMFGAGGGSIFEQTLPLADKLYISYIEDDSGPQPGDIHFPDFDENTWAVERRRQHQRFEFVVYKSQG